MVHVPPAATGAVVAPTCCLHSGSVSQDVPWSLLLLTPLSKVTLFDTSMDLWFRFCSFLLKYGLFPLFHCLFLTVEALPPLPSDIQDFFGLFAAVMWKCCFLQQPRSSCDSTREVWEGFSFFWGEHPQGSRRWVLLPGAVAVHWGLCPRACLGDSYRTPLATAQFLSHRSPQQRFTVWVR